MEQQKGFHLKHVIEFTLFMATELMIDLYTDSTSEKAMQQNIKLMLMYMKKGTADNLADLGTKCSTLEFTRLTGLN
eukprot:6077924-Heterocapsa_arctica.AAC.1